MNGSIRKRGENSWELTIDLGRDAGGKRRRKFVNIKGTKAQAQQKLRVLLSSLDKGLPIGTQKITFGEWLSKWMAEHVVPNGRQTTVERYEGLIRKHIAPVLGRIELSKLSPSDIEALEAKLTAEGMAPKGVELVHTVISGAYKYALRMEAAWRNPAKAVTPPKVTPKEVEPPEIAKVKEILALAEKEGHPLFPCLYLIAYTGLRRGEALGLRHQDLNLKGGVISIIQTVTRSLQLGVIIQPTKTSYSRRSVDLDDGTVAVLRAHLGDQVLHRMELGDVYEDNGLVFPGPLGKPLNPMALTRAFRSYAKKLGLTSAKLHDLRHFHASVMLQNGESLLLVGRRLGHASIATTGDVYGHLLPGWQKEAANAFAKAMERG
ncbi:MAG: site-specific integrase [Dehalococcoidia bacterium]